LLVFKTSVVQSPAFNKKMFKRYLPLTIHMRGGSD